MRANWETQKQLQESRSQFVYLLKNLKNIKKARSGQCKLKSNSFEKPSLLIA